MSTLFEDQASRAERYRKHQLYKNMLDEQIKFKNQYRESQVSAPKFIAPKANANEVMDSYHTPKNQPEPYSRQIYPRNIQNSPHMRFHTQPEEQSEKYLDSCEQIIKNLRELKQKRKERQVALFKMENNLKPVHDNNLRPAVETKKQTPGEAYQHPKARNNQFSASLYKSREPFRDQSVKKRQKPQLKPLKTLQLSARPIYDERRKSMRVTPTSKKVKKIEIKERIDETDEERDKDIESSQPQGIPQSIKNNLKQKSKTSRKSLQKQKYVSKSKSKSKSKSQSKSKSKQRQTSHSKKSLNLQQKQVYECLAELMKYFRAKNEKLAQDRKKGQLVNEQVQVDPIPDEEQQNAKKRDHNVSDLKLKALIKLRQLNQKSRQFVAKVKGAKDQDDKTNKNKSPDKKSLNQNEQDEKTQQATVASNARDQQRLKSRLEQQMKRKKQQEKEQLKRAKEEKQNQQLFKAIANQLNKQQQQNQSLTNCLKELSQYLKDQNEQMETIKTSRMQKIQTPNPFPQKSQSKQKARSKSKNSSGPSTTQKYRSEQFPKPKKSLLLPNTVAKEEVKPKVEHTKEQQSMMKQAFLKRLKKARLRGKLLNQKVQTFKKKHQSQKQQYQQPQQLQINPQLSPEQPKQILQDKQQVVNVT